MEIGAMGAMGAMGALGDMGGMGDMSEMDTFEMAALSFALPLEEDHSLLHQRQADFILYFVCQSFRGATSRNELWKNGLKYCCFNFC